MKFKTSGIGVVDIIGSLGGTVFGKNASGNQCYSRSPAINNHSSPSQHRTRGLLSLVSAVYRTITKEQRAAWKSSAATFPAQHLIFGTPHKLNGRSLFMRLNCNLRLLGQPLKHDPPLPHPAIYTMFSEWLDTSANQLQLHLQLSAFNPLSRQIKILIQSTRDVSPGNCTPRNTRLISYNLNPLQNWVILLAPLFFAEYGFYPKVGSKIFFTLRIVDMQTGESYAPWITEVIVT